MTDYHRDDELFYRLNPNVTEDEMIKGAGAPDSVEVASGGDGSDFIWKLTYSNWLTNTEDPFRDALNLSQDVHHEFL